MNHNFWLPNDGEPIAARGPCYRSPSFVDSFEAESQNSWELFDVPFVVRLEKVKKVDTQFLSKKWAMS